ncbi:MAG: KpsF/GutQ family sugar-phosphate isomerase [Holosporales bacterium]|jgi:arabinose-5-phosphate isomerase|nr:KpsF/GutQ family sugar-phosphate isomerase [Holosporales bacterium]
MNFLDEAKRVIIEEAEALKLLAEQLPQTFEGAVELILNSDGRLVVSGIGKSGHIGKKISATMSSLGQKSFFLHPSEAHHGDLGMLDEKDVLLLISYSGESVELFPVINFAKRLGIKIVSISKNDNSTIARNSDFSLCLPIIKEACPFGAAPTVSSTTTLALGDALSIALLSKRGFTREQFKMIHPGGALGKNLSFVFDIMHKDAPILKTGESMQEAIIIISKFGFGCVGITDHEGKFVGVITDGDLRRSMCEELLSKSVDEVMTRTPVIIDKNVPALELLHMMETRKITSIFVLDENKYPMGIVHIHDLLLKKIV